MFYFFPWYSKYRGWIVMKHQNGRDEIQVDFISDAKIAAGLAMKFNRNPEYVK